MTRRPIAASLLILAAWGCQSTPPPEMPPAAPPAETPAVAEAPEDLLSAAADASGARADRLYLQAAEEFLNDNDLDNAAQALAGIDPRRLRDREAARYWIATAAVALAGNDLDRADAALDAVDERHVRATLTVALLRADLRSRQGEPATAFAWLTEHSAAHPELFGTPDGQRLNDAIWRHLADMPTLEFLGRTRPARGSAGNARAAGAAQLQEGWWELKSQMLSSFTLADQQRRLAAWQAQWPRHPAALQPPGGIGALAQPAQAVTRVGVLLPLSGPLSRAGRAVRDGFIGTYLAHRGDVGFEVLIYDVAAQPLAEVYEQALRDGANVLIGPLARETVAELNRLNPEVPVLLLNYLGDEPPAPNVLQLGLAIEDEAATLARWLGDQQARRLMVFHNDEEWSVRAMQAMSRNWNGPLNVQALGDIRTVTESVGAAMHVATSQQRQADLQNLLRQNLEFVPRARGDIDAIVALVSPVEVGALVPALRFHFAHQVPIYATSQTLRGVQQARLSTLNGFHITELPWFVVDTESYGTLNEAFALDGNLFASLYALGVDAFRLTERVPLIVEGNLRELIGSTGILRFNGNGRIDRSLARAVVRNGRLEYAARRAGP